MGVRKNLFQEVSLNITLGQFVGISGESGIGKSTLLYILAGLKKPTTGEVYYGNQNILYFSEKELLKFRKKNFGFVFQEHFLINYLTSKENILLPVEKINSEIMVRLEKLIEFLKIKDIVDKFPHNLSVGQKQRVSIARALIRNPRYLFADEPTASLDEENSQRVLSLLQLYQKNHNITMIMVSHDHNQREYFDRIIEIKNQSIEDIIPESLQ